MKKFTTRGLLFSVLILAGCTIAPKQETPSAPTTEVVIPNPTEMPTEPTDVQNDSDIVVPGYPLEEIAKHNTQTDCWTAINGNVYNITSAFGKHKGGDEALMKLCGLEGTATFEQQHGTNDQAKSRLDTLKIGWLQ
jgi:cytochrome b involved in lipid metabolism